MKVYNFSITVRIFVALLLVGALSLYIYFIVNQTFSGEITSPERGFLLLFLLAALRYRDLFASFTIDQEGITNKFPGRNFLIPWDEMEYIGVAYTKRVFAGGYRFLMYFAKIRPDQAASVWGKMGDRRQNKRQFFIIYQEGMLEEILNYVDETRIRDVELIQNCKYPHAMQWSKPKVSDEDW